MKKLNALFLFFSSLFFLSIHAQELDWAGSFQSAAGAGVNGSALDAAGNIYTAGYFDGTADFDPGAGTYNLTTAGANDIFITKLDASGNLVWAKSIGSTGNDRAEAITLDASGNIYVTGEFTLTVDFDPGSGTSYLTSSGAYDIFVLKLDAAGNFAWAKSMGDPTQHDYGVDIAAGASGNVYVTGTFMGTADFNPGSGVFNMTSAGNFDIFYLKLDASGNFAWAKRIGGSGGDSGRSLVLDAAENIYSTGNFSGTVDFDPGPGTSNLVSAGGSYEIYYSKLNASGNYVWAKRIGGNTTYEESDQLVLDASGYLYSTGCFSATVDFDPGAGIANLVSGGTWDIFVNKLDTAGNYIWARSVSSTGSTERGTSLAVDASGNVYYTGIFAGTADFDPGSGTFILNPTGWQDFFVSKLDASGNFAWTKSFGSSGYGTGKRINVGSAGSVYTSGEFNNTIDFDPGPGTANISAPSGVAAVFIQKLNQCTSVTYTETITACPPFTWRNGVTYTTSQTGVNYTANGAVNGGCDSVYTLNLTITPNTVALTASTQSDISCFGSSDGIATVNAATGGSGSYTYNWTPGNPAGDGTTSVTGLAAGTWTCTATDANGCGATQSFTIAEPAAITGSFTHTACDSYTWNSQAYTASGIYTQSLTAANGCDSTVTLNLTINHPTTGTDVITACDTYTWIDGITYTASNNTATHVLANSVGCDSTVTLNLTINHPTTGSDVITACDTYTWIDGITYTASNNTATHVLTNSVGCDSTVTLNLTINHPTTGTDVITACDTYTWIDGITYTASNNTATHVLTNSVGCDSIVTLSLTIDNTPAVTISDNGSGTLTASPAASYQWIDCSTNQPVAGETGMTFSPVANGTYAVIAYSAGLCADTSACMSFNYLGLTEPEHMAWTIAPNPAVDQVIVTFNSNTATLIIRDAQGRTVSTKAIYSGEAVSLQELRAGVYFAELITAEGKAVKRIVKM